MHESINRIACLCLASLGRARTSYIPNPYLHRKAATSAPKSYTHCFQTARSHKMERIFTSQASRAVIFDQVHFSFAFSNGA